MRRGSLNVYTTFINRYDREDSLNYNYSEEFIESGISQIFSIGQTTKKGLISKIGVNGDVIWEKGYTVANEQDSLEFKKIIQLKQQSPSSSYFYIVYATTGKNHYLLCIKQTGEVFWARQFNWDNNLIDVQIIASVVDSNFYVSISEQIPISNQPQVVRFDFNGNFVNGESLNVTQKDFVISSIDIDFVGIVLAGYFSETDGSHGVIVRLDKNLRLLSTLMLVEPYTLIQDIKIINRETYLISGYKTKEEIIFVTKLQENKEQSESILLPNKNGKFSQLQLNADGFYLLEYDSENGILYNLNQEFVIKWTKEIKFVNGPNGFRNFRFNINTDKLTFNVYSSGSNGSLLGHTNKELQSCLTNILEKPSIKKDIINVKKFDLDPKKFEIALKAARTVVLSLNSKKIELCPVFVDLCGEEDVLICTLYSDISSIFNECLEDPNLPQNDNVSVFEFIKCMQAILELIETFSKENPNYDLLTLLAHQIKSIQNFLAKVEGQSSNHVIVECGCYQDAWSAVGFIISYLDDLGNCNCSCDGKNYTLLHEVCWLTVEDYEYNVNIPDQAAVSADAQATIKGINDFIQPVWRPDTSYYVHFELRDLVENVGSIPFKFTYGFTTGGPIGYFHTHEKATYGDMPLKAGQYIDTDAGPILLTNAISGKVLEDTKGIIRNPDGSEYALPSGNPLNPIAKIAPHPDKYALTSLGQYIDYERSYPNANGNLLSAKPLFYNDENTKISLFFNKAYAKNFFREWPLYNGKAAQKGMLKIVIKDPIESSSPDIVNPPSLDYIPSIVTIPQTEEVWVEDENPQIPFVLSQYEAMFNVQNCIIEPPFVIIKPKSEYTVITPKHLKPNKLYSAIVNNMYSKNNSFEPLPAFNQTKEVHRFVFKTSRYATFKEQVESYRIQQNIDGQLVEKEARFTIENRYTPEQVDGAYTTIVNWINGNINQIPLTGFSTEVLDNLNNNYQHPFDRVFEGILGFKPVDEAISTEVNILRNLEDNKIVALLVRNPEPFNNPKMPRVDVLDTMQVFTGNTVSNDYKVLHSKDYSQTIIMHTSKEITNNLTLQFKYKIWNGSNYVVPNEDLNPSTPNLYTVILEIEI